MQMKVHTQGWAGSSPIKKGEQPGASFGGYIEIDGEVYDRVNDIHLEYGETFATLRVTFIPGSVEIVTHTEESWEKLDGRVQDREARAVARTGIGRSIAVYVSPKEDDE